MTGNGQIPNGFAVKTKSASCGQSERLLCRWPGAGCPTHPRFSVDDHCARWHLKGALRPGQDVERASPHRRIGLKEARLSRRSPGPPPIRREGPKQPPGRMPPYARQSPGVTVYKSGAFVAEVW